MTHLLAPRDYQEECITQVVANWYDHQRVAAVLPTGTGKTVIFAHMINQWLTANPTRRALVLAHTEELCEQAASKMRLISPDVPVGIVKAGRNETHTRVIVGSVQTLRNPTRLAQLSNVGMIIVDEAHHATAATYQTILRGLGGYDPTSGVKVAGFTATLARGDGTSLASVWETVAFKKDIAWFIRRGYLLDVKGTRIPVDDFDLSLVKKSGGDYATGSLGEQLTRSLAPETVAKGYVEHASDRQGLLFAPTIETAYLFADALKDVGISAATVHGGTPDEERRLTLKRLISGDIQVVTNCMVLTEGFDAPCVSCVVVARPTRSAPLYQQMVGRALRPDLTIPPDQRGHALVLDVTGVSGEHNLTTLIDLSSRRDLTDVPEDASLLELEDMEMEEATGERERPQGYVGPVDWVPFDPLAANRVRAWNVTANGTHFLSAAKQGYVFVVPSVFPDSEPGTFDVVWCSSSGPMQAKVTDHKGMPFEMALSWAEDAITEIGGYGIKTLSGRTASWRKVEATEAQKVTARRLGISFDDTPFSVVTKGELSAQIDQVLASRRIDPLVKKVTGK